MCVVPQRVYPIYQLLHSLEQELEHVSLLEMMIHFEAYEDLHDSLTLTVVVDQFLLSVTLES